MADRAFVPKHNMTLSLDPQANGADQYVEIISFLMRSRVYHVLTHAPTLYIEYIRQFWATASYDCTVTPPVIRANVNGRAIQFSAADLRNILLLGTEAEEDGPTEYPDDFRMGGFQRMGYVGDLGRSNMIKSNVYGQWRYLMHVMIVSLSARKAGLDAMGVNLQCGLLSLVYNKPFSFSRFFFNKMTNQISALRNERFLLYPRFVMMIINHLIPDLPPHRAVVQVHMVDRRIYADCRGHNSKKPINQRPVLTPLFGYLLNVNYVAPPNNGWMDVVQPAPEGEAHAQPAAAEAGEAAAQVDQEQQQQAQLAPEQPEGGNVQQAILDDVFHHAEQPGGAEAVDALVVDEVVHAVFQPGERDEVDDTAEFLAAGGVFPDFEDEERQADQGAGTSAGVHDDSDSEDLFMESSSPPRVIEYGKRVMGVHTTKKRPQELLDPDFSLLDEEEDEEETEYQIRRKRRRPTQGVVIREPSAGVVPTSTVTSPIPIPTPTFTSTTISSTTTILTTTTTTTTVTIPLSTSTSAVTTSTMFLVLPYRCLAVLL